MEIQVPSLLRIKPNVLIKLGKYLRQVGYTSIALFWGKGLRTVFGETVDITLASSEVTVLWQEEVASNEIDKAFESSKKLPDKTIAVVAVGGGTVIDFCKYVALSRQLPMVSVPTLISNDAFASPISSLIVNKRRQSLKTVVPHMVIIDTAIVAGAPRHFLYSGIGDIISKTTALFDWKLAFKKKGETVNDFAAVVAATAADSFSNYIPKQPENVTYIGMVASSLLMSGIAMVIAGSSRPASGSEHCISHAYDQIAKKPSLHGLQVGVASYAVSAIQEVTHARLKLDIVQSGLYDYMKNNPLDRADFIKAIQKAPEIKEDYYTILNERDAISQLADFVKTDQLMKDMVV
ncbi:MAG: iron-containing alcohol dehydrogenase family protein [Chitinivibrionales bacterium]|nr:iron-containing alcohol dehydrogenase family protein [Chitinivibrionales bacterium]